MLSKNHNKIIVTIIIPFFNIIKFRNIFLKKIKKIYDSNFQYIFVDDGSKDDTLSFLKKKLKKQNFFFLKLKKNCGPGIARNEAMKIAKGKYILFLDFDDTIVINSLKKISQTIKNKSFDLYYYDFAKKNFYLKKLCDFKKIDSSFALSLFLRKELDMSVNHCLFNNNFLKENKIIFRAGIYEDIVFMCKCLLKAKKISSKKILVYIKQKRKFSITNTFSNKNTEYFIKSSIEKYKIFFNNKFFFDSLQYGLRGDYCSVLKMNKKSNVKIKKKFIDKIFKKMINANFIENTNYDKIVNKNLF